jgi:hypothetical protein
MLAIFKKKSQKNICYTSCSEVYMTAFIKAIVKQDYSGLIKKGSPKAEELALAWQKVLDEYLTISGDTNISTVLALLKEIEILSNKITLIEFVVSQMAQNYHQGFAEQLHAMGFRFKYEDGPELMRELELTIVQSKSLLVQLNQSKAELAELRGDDGKAATEMDYEMQLSELGKFQGYSLNPDKLTVTAYCAILKRFKIHNTPKAA